MFPLSADKLSFLKIADYWSRESRASQNELLAQLEAAWWLGEIVGNSAITRLQFLKNMYQSRHEPDMQSIVFVTQSDAGPPTDTPLADGGVIVDVRPRINVPGETDAWTEDSCNDAFQELARLPSQQYFPQLSYSICYIDLTYEEFFGWARSRGFDLPGFWKPSVVKGGPAATEEDSSEDAGINLGQKIHRLPQARPRVSEAEAHKIYEQYRKDYDGIPTRDEDATYMKQFGVSRNWVRKERCNYPRRKRGEKKNQN
jgi:hypothetical protein